MGLDQIIVGVAVVAAGVGVVTGQLWGRLVGMTLAALSMLANFAFIPYYPVWSLSIIALNVFVIWALCVYNRDTAAGSTAAHPKYRPVPPSPTRYLGEP